MKKMYSCLIFGVIIILLESCESDKNKHTISQKKLSDSLICLNYIDIGDSLAAQKKGFESFARALVYFDSASRIAEKNQNNYLLATCYFAYGRMYDAWNKEPQKTIIWFEKAANLMAKQPNQYVRCGYLKHLVAHAYDKIKDSTNCTKVLEEMYENIKTKPDSIRHKMQYIPEMSLIATEIKNYPLALKLLTNLYRREWIVNNPETYNYLDHYYLTKSRIEIFYHKNSQTPYLDSLESVIKKSSNSLDSMYIGRELSSLYDFLGNDKKTLFFYKISSSASEKLNNVEGIGSLQNKLLQSELENEKRKQEYNLKDKQYKIFVLWFLGFVLVVISILLYRLRKKTTLYQNQSIDLARTNEDLDRKVSEIALLNKEMQHRIKNNLQTVFSLLQMQERKTENNQTIEDLQQARLRIESIAALHEQLIKGEHNNHLDFRTFVSNMVNNVINCFANGKQVVTHLDIHEIKLSTDYNFSLALILNEWITNSVKYAQPENNSITIYLTISQTSEFAIIEYRDNGKLTTDSAQNNGLGTEIVTLLSAQMKALMTTNSINCYHYTLNIPHEQ